MAPKMAPKKRKAEAKNSPLPFVSPRVTRSSVRPLKSIAAADSLPSKKQKKGAAATKAKPGVADKKASLKHGDVTATLSKTVIIEHCKQCNSFKTRALEVKEGLENVLAGITVVLNPDKPRRGCFEIRDEGGEKFISLLGLQRPYKKMKDLDMDNVISDIVKKLS